MTLFKLSFKNIRKSFKDYAIYFFTLILGVAIFYVFNAIDSQTVMMNVSKSTYDIIQLMTSLLSGVSVFISFVLGFLIIYASRFLIKRRNKEFGIYLTLGMSKRKISMILFFETLFIGIISLIVGLGIGTILSQFMSILVANMFEADMTNFTFVFSTSACVKTMIYFGIMYFIVMIFNTANISKCKLIDLLYANKKSETIKLKNPLLCIIVFLISSIVLGFAYYMVTAGLDQYLQGASSIFIPIIMGSVSTFFIFWSLSGLLLKLFMSMKKTYYKGLNSFTLRQISSKINTTVFSMTIICLMLFVTICVLSSGLSVKNSMTANLRELAPLDIQLMKKMNMTEEALNEGKTAEQIEDSYHSVRYTMEQLDFSIDDNLKDIFEFNLYATPDVTIKETLGSYYKEVKAQYPYLTTDSVESFIKISDYNKLAKLYGLEQYTLKDNEYILVADFDAWVEIRDRGLKVEPVIHLLGKDYKPKYKESKNGFVYMGANHSNIGFFIVPDSAVNDNILQENIIVGKYKASNEEEKKQIEEKLMATESSSYAPKTTVEAITKIALRESSNGLGALMTFIALYLGIIFLISSAAILALKELSESSDNKQRFMMLRKIGTDEAMINRALFRQIAIFFMFPLIIAIIHSIFGIIFCNNILATIGTKGLMTSILMTALFLIIIYGGYFLITYFCSKNIIKDK